MITNGRYVASAFYVQHSAAYPLPVTRGTTASEKQAMPQPYQQCISLNRTD